MSHRFIPNPTPCGRSRRQFLWEVGGGFAGLALTDLLTRDGFFTRTATAAGNGQSSSSLLAAKTPHFPTKAKHAVFLFMNGAPSQVDTFDPKPALTRFHGSPYKGPLEVGSNNRAIGYLMQSPFPFRRHGRSGLEISSLFPHTAKFADDLCVIRSMYTDTAAHASGCLQMNTGNVTIGKPCLGSWLSYGLGTLNESLPSFVVMTDPAGRPHQRGFQLDSPDTCPHPSRGPCSAAPGRPCWIWPPLPASAGKTQRHSLDLLRTLNEEHLASRPREDELAGRINTYELAYRMQTTAAEAVDLDREDEATREMYGLNRPLTADFGRKCLITRRLLENGVRFVQLYSGGGHIEDTWDGPRRLHYQSQAPRRGNRPAHRRPDRRPQTHRPVGRNPADLGR